MLGLAACGPVGLEAPMPETADRVWLGPDWHANRLQDWMLKDGRVHATEGRASKPMRTAHLQTVWLARGDGTFSTDLLVHGAAASPDSAIWGGLLLGAGDAETDYRISLLTHHWPGPGGGLVVAVDGLGRLVVRDNESYAGRHNPGASYPTSDWPLLAASPPAARLPDPVRLHVEAGAGGLLLELTDPAGGSPLARLQVQGFESSTLEGTAALLSHGSPLGDGAGYAFSGWTLSGSKLQKYPDRSFGPVLGVQYTLSEGRMALTAQFGPLGSSDATEARLELRGREGWRSAGIATIDPDARTATFRREVEDGQAYRVLYRLDGQEHWFAGEIRPEPQGVLTLAGLNCHHISGGDGSWSHRHFWYPHAELTTAVAHHDPDVLFFAGDQIYEGGLEGIVRQPEEEAILDYLNHWYRFVRAFRDLMRDRPTITIPDDHDVYHGNIWGAGGKAATGPHSPASDNGGYIMTPAFVNVVHRTQTSHLPAPVDPEPIAQGITVYHTTVEWGGMSMAVLADRMWKSAPRDLLPEAEIWNGWPQNLEFDVASRADLPDAELLGPRQERFLESWADDWRAGAQMKVVLSQTPFVNVATIPEDALSGAVIPGLPNPAPGEYPAGYKMATDFDSGAWPQHARDRAVRSMRRAFAVHIAGDQHLGSVVQYGVDDWRDAGYVFTLPSIANIWPRRWFPPAYGANRKTGAPGYTGDFLDGFGNRMTVHAVANPVDSGHEPSALYDRTPGYGIVRFDMGTRTTTFEAWPRWVNPADLDAAQYADWPVAFEQRDGYRFSTAYRLPQLDWGERGAPVVRVEDEASGEWVYTVRWPSSEPLRPWVPDREAAYRVILRDPSNGRKLILEGLRVE